MGIRVVNCQPTTISVMPLFGQEHVERYRATDGEEGHDWQGTQTLLLTTMGRRSGQRHTTPLIYAPRSGAYMVVASKGGSDSPPAWYLNLADNPEVEVQVKGDRFKARAVPPAPRRSLRCGARWPPSGPPTTSIRRRRRERSR